MPAHAVTTTASCTALADLRHLARRWCVLAGDASGNGRRVAGVTTTYELAQAAIAAGTTLAAAAGARLTGETIDTAAAQAEGRLSGEANMSHSIANLEHHHFKFEGHRRPGDAHVHFFGAHSLSFGDGVVLKDGDWMEVRYDGFGRALRNPIRVEPKERNRQVVVRSLR